MLRKIREEIAAARDAMNANVYAGLVRVELPKGLVSREPDTGRGVENNEERVAENVARLLDRQPSTPNTENFHRVVKGKDSGQLAAAKKLVEESKKKGA